VVVEEIDTLFGEEGRGRGTAEEVGGVIGERVAVLAVDGAWVDDPDSFDELGACGEGVDEAGEFMRVSGVEAGELFEIGTTHD
jgi:hypothetical protein